MNVPADQGVVDLSNPLELLFAQRRQRGRGYVLSHLLAVAGAGDDGADARLIDHPAQCELRQRLPRIDQCGQLASGGYADFVGDP